MKITRRQALAGVAALPVAQAYTPVCTPSHPEIRAAVRAFEAAYARMALLDAESDRRFAARPEDESGEATEASHREWCTWHQVHAQPAVAVAHEAWTRLLRAVERSGASAVICGGRYYHANVNRPALDATVDDVYELGSYAVPVAAILDLDSAG